MELLFTVPWYDVIWCDTVTARYLLTVFVGPQPEHIALFMENVQWSAVTLFMCGCVSVNGVCVFVWPRLCQRQRDGVRACVLKKQWDWEFLCSHSSCWAFPACDPCLFMHCFMCWIHMVYVLLYRWAFCFRWKSRHLQPPHVLGLDHRIIGGGGGGDPILNLGLLTSTLLRCTWGFLLSKLWTDSFVCTWSSSLLWYVYSCDNWASRPFRI